VNGRNNGACTILVEVHKGKRILGRMDNIKRNVRAAS
jgi:hypothetical protein